MGGQICPKIEFTNPSCVRESNEIKFKLETALWKLETKKVMFWRQKNSELRTSVGSEISSRNFSISCTLNSPSYFNTGLALSFRLKATTDGFPVGTSNLNITYHSWNNVPENSLWLTFWNKGSSANLASN